MAYEPHDEIEDFKHYLAEQGALNSIGNIFVWIMGAAAVAALVYLIFFRTL
jgi:hypothetical protein